MGEVRLRRDEEDLLYGREPEASSPVPTESGSTAEALAAFLRTVEQGERLDPDNAFFPLMRAVGLFAGHRDAEALSAIRLAATKRTFEDYVAEEPRGLLRLRGEAFGERSAIPRAVIPAATLFPHSARIRALTRVATYKAVEHEREGRAEEGAAIRGALIRCASRMRADSHTATGSLAGIALVPIAVTRPGGGPCAERPPGVAGKEWTRVRLESYAAYLEETGQQNEAKWFRTEVEARGKAKSLLKRGMQVTPLTQWTTWRHLFGLWVTGMVLLCNALWFLLVARGATALARRRQTGGIVVVAALLSLLVLTVTAFSLSRWAETLVAVCACTMQLAGTDETGGIRNAPFRGASCDANSRLAAAAVVDAGAVAHRRNASCDESSC